MLTLRCGNQWEKVIDGFERIYIFLFNHSCLSCEESKEIDITTKFYHRYITKNQHQHKTSWSSYDFFYKSADLRSLFVRVYPVTRVANGKIFRFKREFHAMLEYSSVWIGPKPRHVPVTWVTRACPQSNASRGTRACDGWKLSWSDRSIGTPIHSVSRSPQSRSCTGMSILFF